MAKRLTENQKKRQARKVAFAPFIEVQPKLKYVNAKGRRKGKQSN